MKALEETFQQTMPPEMGYNYMGMSFQEKKAEKGVSPTGSVRLLALICFPDSGCPLRKLVVAI